MIKEKGNLGAIFNASNEEAVYAFLDNKIPFLMIEEIIRKCLKEVLYIKHPTLAQIIKSDEKSREFARKLIENGGNR